MHVQDLSFKVYQKNDLDTFLIVGGQQFLIQALLIELTETEKT